MRKSCVFAKQKLQKRSKKAAQKLRKSCAKASHLFVKALELLRNRPAIDLKSLWNSLYSHCAIVL
jgi:hypothetical protein